MTDKLGYNILTFILISMATFIVHADAMDSTKEKEILLLTGSSPPFVYLNENREIVGTSVKQVKSYLEKANISYQLKLQVWPRVLETLKNNKNIFLFPLSRIPEREHKFKWIAPLHKMHMQLYGLNDKISENISDISSGNYKFACVKNTLVCSVLNTFGVKEENIIYISELNLQHMLRLIQYNRIDFVVLNDENYLKAVELFKDSSQQLFALKNYQIEIYDYLATSLNTDESILEKFHSVIEKQPEN